MTLLCFLLLLLAEANLEHFLFGFLEGFVIVTRHSVFDVSVRIGVLRKDSHQSETFVANWTEWAKALHIRNRHNTFRLSYSGFLTLGA